MPYLDKKISDKHKSSCSNPKAKRLYIRDYGDKGQQIFIPYGITCPTCKVIILDTREKLPVVKAKVKPKPEPKKMTTKDKKWKERELKVSQIGVVKECLICHQPTTMEYNSFDNMRSNIARRYGGQGLGCYYQDGKRITDIKMEDVPACCNRCHKKHFAQHGSIEYDFGTPITNVGIEASSKHCIFPYPTEKDKGLNDPKPQNTTT